LFFCFVFLFCFFWCSKLKSRYLCLQIAIQKIEESLKIEKTACYSPRYQNKEDDEEEDDELNITELVECLVEGDVDSVEQYMETLSTEKRELKRTKVHEMFRQLMNDKGVTAVQEDRESVMRPVFDVTQTYQCSRCDIESTSCSFCENCAQLFCIECSEMIHEKGVFSTHKLNYNY